jgi:tyrosine phenol-lyase
MAGGQPVSMANPRSPRNWPTGTASDHDRRHPRRRERLFHPAARAGYKSRPVAEILKEFCSYTDGCTMSGKKDAW